MHNSPFFSNLFATLWHRLAGPHEPDIGPAISCGTDTLPQVTGPAVNVDGTPMFDSVVDVMGKVYGDSGSSFSSGSDPFGSATHCTDW